MNNENQKQQVTQEVMTEEQQALLANASTPTIEIHPRYLLRVVDMISKPQVCFEKFIVLAIIGGKNPAQALVELEQEDLIDSRGLNLKIGKQFVGTKISFKKYGLERLQQQLRDQSICKVQYAHAGHQVNCYVYGNAFFLYQTNQLFMATKYIPEKDYKCMENSLVDVKNPCIPMIYPSTKTSLEIMQKAMPQFVKTFNSSDVLLCVGGALAISMRDVFMGITGCMPSIFLFGAYESGKSTIMDFISAIYGLPDNSMHTAGNSTVYAISKSIQARRNIPAFVDDLLLDILNKLEPIVKNSFHGLSRERGKKDGIDKIEVHTNIVATANEFWKNPTPQLLSRVLFAYVKKDDFDLSGFEYFHPEARKELSLILPLIFQCKSQIPAIYKNVYATLCTLTNLSGKRHLFCIAISCTMWVIINHILGYELVNWQKIAIDYNTIYQSYLNTEVKSSDIILNDITRLIDADKLDYGQDYKLIHGTILRLNLNRYIEKFNVANPQNIMSPAQFRLLVANDKRFNTKTVVMKGLNRAISIDVSDNDYLLEEIKIQKNYWLANPANRGDDED